MMVTIMVDDGGIVIADDGRELRPDLVISVQPSHGEYMKIVFCRTYKILLHND